MSLLVATQPRLLQALADHRLANLFPLNRRESIEVEVGSCPAVRHYLVTSAAALGLNGEQLLQLFRQDQRVRDVPFFVDPLAATSTKPLIAYEDGLPLSRLPDLDGGREILDARSTRYFAVASDAVGIHGFVEFVLRFEYAQEAEHDEDPRLHAGFGVELERIYVCKYQRGKGVSAALLRFAAQVFFNELASVVAELAPALSEREEPLPLMHHADATWLSASGRLAHRYLAHCMDEESRTFHAQSPLSVFVTRSGDTEAWGRY